ncbi:MAG: hypothetical protein AAGG72_06915, partial [Pseudomonadota bacterium]
MLIPKEYALTAAQRRLDRAYKNWLHEDMACCLSGRTDVQLAHCGDVTTGKGMAIKSAPWTQLPLSFPLHLAEEANRNAFWEMAIGESPLPWAERLWDCFTTGDKESGQLLLADMRDMANREFLASILERA